MFAHKFCLIKDQREPHKIRIFWCVWFYVSPHFSGLGHLLKSGAIMGIRWLGESPGEKMHCLTAASTDNGRNDGYLTALQASLTFTLDCSPRTPNGYFRILSHFPSWRPFGRPTLPLIPSSAYLCNANTHGRILLFWWWDDIIFPFPSHVRNQQMNIWKELKKLLSATMTITVMNV